MMYIDNGSIRENRDSQREISMVEINSETKSKRSMEKTKLVLLSSPRNNSTRSQNTIIKTVSVKLRLSDSSTKLYFISF